MILHNLTRFVGAGLLASALSAQSCLFYPSDSPAIGASADIPLGVTSPATGWVRYQMQIPSSVLGNQPLDIVELFVAPAGTHTRSYESLAVRMGHNPGPITSSMLFNLPSGGGWRHVVRLADVTFPWTGDQWQPLGMQSTYQFDPSLGTMVVEFLIKSGSVAGGTGATGMHTDPTIPFVWTPSFGYSGTQATGGGIKLRFCTEHSGFIEYQSGACAGSNNLEPTLGFSGTPTLGNTVNIHVTDGPPAANTLTLLAWGFTPRLVPFNLLQLGAPGCSVYVEPNVVFAMTSTGGTNTASLAIPSTIAPHLRLWNQWFFLDPPANPFGLISSNFGTYTIGN